MATSQPVVQPQLSVRDGRAAVDFYKAAFGAVEVYRFGGTDELKEVVAQLAVGDSMFWVEDESPQHGNFSPSSIGGATTRMLLVVDDPVVLVARAIAAGGTEISAVGEEHGWLLGRVADPFGHRWEIGRPLGPWPPVASATGSRSVDEFDEMYTGTPPWEIGRPQPVFVGLASDGTIRGRVLDVGCGTGEHVLMVAERGLDATGIDASPRAIELAEGKAASRGLAARFVVGNALALSQLGGQFDTVLDSGLFHVFHDADRARYVESLGSVVRRGGLYLMCCFSDRQPGDWGPRRVREEEIRDAFGAGWRVESIEPCQFETVLGFPAEAWLARITRA